MSLTFNPPLNQLTTIKHPLHDVDLTFSAKFSGLEQHNAAKNAGIRVEMWSDILHGVGPWSAHTFRWSHDSLILTIPSAGIKKSRSAFTYRLVYPNGQIKWLGNDRQNGELAVEFEDERFELTNGWRNDGKGLVLTPSALDSTVLKLTDRSEWAIWSFTAESAPRKLSLADGLESAHSALFVPRQFQDAIVPFAPFLLTSQTNPFTISRSGSVVTSGALSIQPPTLDNLKACLPDSTFIDNNSNHVIILTQRDSSHVNPAHLSLIPLAPYVGQNVSIKIPIPALSSQFSPETLELALYSPSSPGPCFVSASTEFFEVTSGFGGSQWTVAPVYSLDDTEVKIVVFTPHSKIDMPSTLPTPPPSPLMPQIMTQPMHIPEQVEEEEAGAEAEEEQPVVLLPKPLRVSRNLGMIRRIFNFYTGLIWWILGMLFKRSAPPKSPELKPVTSPKTKSNSSSVVGSGASTPSGVRSSSMTTTTTGTATPTTPGGGFVFDEEVFTSPTIEKNLEETTREWHFEDAKEVKEQHQALTFDIPATPTIKLYIRGFETQKQVEALRFGLNGKEVAPYIAAMEGGWLIELVSEASGRFTIRV